MTAGSEMTQTQARVAANALVFGYFGALEQWYLDGGIHPIATYVEEGMRPLRRIWATPDGSGTPLSRSSPVRPAMINEYQAELDDTFAASEVTARLAGLAEVLIPAS